MLQGTGSDVGKSVLTAGLCRVFASRGLRVRPFKPQNMSNNAAATRDGGEIGRAQALQAIAARVEPATDMNPVLLKPQSDRMAQVVVHGRVYATLEAGEYRRRSGELLGAVCASYARLRAQADLVIVEGAGSPAEINLRAGDIANMGFARAAGVPVVLVGDIDRGGVIAAMVGTKVVLDSEDAALVRGFLINKFRGDPRLFDDGYRAIAAATGWRGLGVAPWLAEAALLPAEDAVALERTRGQTQTQSGKAVIAVPRLARIANFDDCDALAHEPGVALHLVAPGSPLPVADLVILPGTKATIADLAFLRAQGWDIDLLAHVRRGGRVLGICGGYQMLGERIADPEGVEGAAGAVGGLGLLPAETVIGREKHVRPVEGRLAAAPVRFAGYEIHAGVTRVAPGVAPLLRFDDGRPDGAISGDGRIAGAYVHGLFDRPEMRAHWLAALGAESDGLDRRQAIDRALDRIAGHLERALDVEAILGIAMQAA